MLSRRAILTTGLGLVSLAASRAEAEPKRPVLDLRSLPGREDYRIDPFLEAASAVQDQGERSGRNALRAEAKRLERELTPSYRESEALIILCRMLFEPRPHQSFRRPGLGGPSFVGGGSTEDWPLEPITLTNGIPFLIVRGYTLQGKAEFGWDYLSYCEKECAWSKARYAPASSSDKARALADLVAAITRRWPQNLVDRSFLASQLGHAKPETALSLRITAVHNGTLGPSVTVELQNESSREVVVYWAQSSPALCVEMDVYSKTGERVKAKLPGGLRQHVQKPIIGSLYEDIPPGRSAAAEVPLDELAFSLRLADGEYTGRLRYAGADTGYFLARINPERAKAFITDEVISEPVRFRVRGGTLVHAEFVNRAS